MQGIPYNYDTLNKSVLWCEFIHRILNYYRVAFYKCLQHGCRFWLGMPGWTIPQLNIRCNWSVMLWRTTVIFYKFAGSDVPWLGSRIVLPLLKPCDKIISNLMNDILYTNELFALFHTQSMAFVTPWFLIQSSTLLAKNIVYI